MRMRLFFAELLRSFFFFVRLTWMRACATVFI